VLEYASQKLRADRDIVLAAVQQDDVRRMRFLEVFQDQYDIATSVDALVHAPEFLNNCLLNDFDYRKFVQSSGLVDDDLTVDDFGIYEKQNLREDVTIGVSVILELVTKIAMKMGISMDEAMAGMPGGSAVRIVPKCCALSRWLPGALCTVRALKAGKAIYKPIYNHDTGFKDPPELIEPNKVMVIEGLHPLMDEGVRKTLDLGIYIDIVDEVKFAWKVQRDVAERGWTEEQVKADI